MVMMKASRVELLSRLHAMRKDVSGNLRVFNPLDLEPAAISEEWSPSVVTDVDLDAKTLIGVVVPFAYACDSRERHGEAEA